MISIDLEELKRLYYDEQKSGFEIARHFQTFPQVIYNRMRKHGLQRRPLQKRKNYGTQRQRHKDIYQH